MAQIQVRLGPVLGDKDLAVLIGAHGARVYINIRVQFLGRHLQAPGLQKPSERRCGDPLSQPGDHAAGNENVFCHMSTSSVYSAKK